MYLSRLILNPRTRRVQRELANPYEFHRTLMTAFPSELPAGERVLYRLDTEPHSGVPIALLQSQTRPDWAWLGDPAAQGYMQRAPETKTFNLDLKDGQMLAFRLRANPTVKRWLPQDRGDAGSTKKPMRLPIVKEDALREWLGRKGSAGGFRLTRMSLHQEGNLKAYKPRRGGGAGQRRALTFYAVLFEGVIQVTDPEALVRTVAQGVGPAKGFGFGLLSLALPR